MSREIIPSEQSPEMSVCTFLATVALACKVLKEQLAHVALLHFILFED